MRKTIKLKDLSKWTDILCPWIRINIVEISVLLHTSWFQLYDILEKAKLLIQ